MRLGLAVLVVLTAACTQGGQTAVKSPAPTPVSSPSAAPSPSPVPGDLPVSQVSFSCRLPIYLQTGYEGSADFSRKGAFITFPAATMTIDPKGKGGGYFDRAFNRWLPVTQSGASPDGAHYAYADMNQSELHVVDVVGGKERTYSLSAIGANYVFDYGADGIYMTFGFEGLHGLWLVDPVTGSSHQLPDVATPGAIGAGGVVWYSEVNPADPQPINTASSAGILADQVTRLDLKSGSKTQWLYQPGVGFDVSGLDELGRPLIGVVHAWMDVNNVELLLAPDARTQKVILKGQVVGTLGFGIADSHGVWFGSQQGIYLYSDTGGFQKVSNQPGFPANGCV
ncbi:MAG TPA: hypothetical protein VG426_06470 [Candidatus Dormibacteraeota bacterium]|jgi:hypothetical protein|nr:hypothetical protein [Candidatus Dormibacteraeota bacterium]